jgi:hypothetical protein
LGGLVVLLVLLLIFVSLAALRGVGGLFVSEQGGSSRGGIEEAGQQPTGGVGGSEEPSGYVLLPEGGTNGYGELLFLQVVREGAELPGGGQSMRGYLSNTTAFYEPGLPIAQMQTNTVEGTIDNKSLEFTAWKDNSANFVLTEFSEVALSPQLSLQ